MIYDWLILRVMTRFSTVFIFISAMFSCLLLTAQTDYSWWEQKHNWDGQRHWSTYQITSAKYFGPNALPPSRLLNGRIDTALVMEGRFSYHHSQGEEVGDANGYIYIPIAKNKVGLAFESIAAEYYSMDTITRDIRASRDYDGKGWAVGDLYISTLIQLYQDKSWGDLMLGINIMTSSGSNREATRHIDRAGYYFDMTWGKSLELGSNGSIRPYASLGFFAYETNEPQNGQNDAPTYGIGLDTSLDEWTMSHQFRGYRGWKKNGDAPLVYRFRLDKRLSNNWSLGFRLQQGLHDFEYTTYSLLVRLVL